MTAPTIYNISITAPISTFLKESVEQAASKRCKEEGDCVSKKCKDFAGIGL
jgi:hypothetical protein